MLFKRIFVGYKANTLSAILLSICTLTVMYDVVSGLKCPPCSKIHCSPRRASRLQCKGGITTGICGCCPKCAKVENEECGGEYSYRGKCDKHLRCVASATNIFISRTHTLRKDTVGVCKRVKRKSHDRQSDAAFIDVCRPKCTPNFCKKHPKAICSASDAADTIIDCHGKCQHTSCRACAFVKEPTCQSCKRDDFRCLKKFGKCIQRHVCAMRKQSCKWGKRTRSENEGKLVCKVPSCS